MLRRYGRYGRGYAAMTLRFYAKDVRFGTEARGLLMQGVNIMANAVGCTLGPKGRNALIEQLLRSPKITKDGITVANNVKLVDRRCNAGAQLLRQATNNTNNEVGDGSSTATILAQSMTRQGLEIIRQGKVNVHELREGILQGSREVCEELSRMSQPVESIAEVKAVAKNALNGDEKLAELIAQGIEEIGESGVILLKESQSVNDEVVVQEGVSLTQGFLSPLLCNEQHRVEYNNVLLLLTLAKIESMADLVPALELAKSQQQPLLIIAQDICSEVLTALALNRLQNNLEVCAVKAPSFGTEQREQMQDLALAMGAHLFENLSWLAKVKMEDFGVVGEAIVDFKSTQLLKPRTQNKEQLKARIDHIRNLLAEAVIDQEVNKLNERLGRLLGQVAILYVGGGSELEVSEKKDRLNDALHAVRVAISDGILPGGGTAYLRCISALEKLPCSAQPDHQLGIEIVKNALTHPCCTIARNAGVNPQEVIQQVLQGEGNFGYDASSGTYCDLVEHGIIDPTNVLRSAMSDAAGIASLLATTEVLITDLHSKTKIAKNQVTRDLAKLVGM